jgi:hypothetical protein
MSAEMKKYQPEVRSKICQLLADHAANDVATRCAAAAAALTDLTILQAPAYRTLSVDESIHKWATDHNLQSLGFGELAGALTALNELEILTVRFNDAAWRYIVCVTANVDALIGCAMIGKSPEDPSAPADEPFPEQVLRVFREVIGEFGLRTIKRSDKGLVATVVLVNKFAGIEVTRERTEGSVDVYLLRLGPGGRVPKPGDHKNRVRANAVLMAAGAQRPVYSWHAYYRGAYEAVLKEFAQALREQAAPVFAGDFALLDAAVARSAVPPQST